MIQFDKDGVTLFYLDANGKKISHNYLEGTAYDEMLNVRGAQIQAMRENTQTAANYNTAVATAQASINAGRPDGIVAPAKPLQKVVADTGEVSYIPFVPPLPDLVPLAVNAPSGPIAVPAVDKQAILYNMILALFRKAFPDA